MSTIDRRTARRAALAALALPLLVAGCRLDMHDQPKMRGMRKSDFFEDGMSVRPIPSGTMARGHFLDDPLLERGVGADGKFVDQFPIPVTREVLARGRQRFDVFCSPCHDRTGSGRGMVVQRGFKQPPSFHQDRLRTQPAGYLYDVASNGFNTMSGYAGQVPVEDRWAIVAWVRVLQYAAHAPAGELAPADLARLAEVAPASTVTPAPPQASLPHSPETK